MVTLSPPVSPSVVAAILIIQNTSVTSGTLLKAACFVISCIESPFLAVNLQSPCPHWFCREKTPQLSFVRAPGARGQLSVKNRNGCIGFDSLTQRGILPAMDIAAQDALILLEWYRAMGVDEAAGATPQDWFAELPPAGAALSREITPAAPAAGAPRFERKPPPPPMPPPAR